jgi:hypothetical protein
MMGRRRGKNGCYGRRTVRSVFGMGGWHWTGHRYCASRVCVVSIVICISGKKCKKDLDFSIYLVRTAWLEIGWHMMGWWGHMVEEINVLWETKKTKRANFLGTGKRIA